MSKKTHSPNCQCNYCTSRDPHIAHIRNQFGKNAAHFDSARSGGSQWGFNDYDSYFLHANHLAATPGIVAEKANLKKILGDALGTVVGDLIQAKKEGQTLPKALDVVANLGIKTEQAAINAAQQKAESETGKQVLKFSPYIIGGVLLVLGLLVFFIFKKK